MSLRIKIEKNKSKRSYNLSESFACISELDVCQLTSDNSDCDNEP